jgi:hypothetical protein
MVHIIGVDAHKLTHTMVVVNDAGRKLGEKTLNAGAARPADTAPPACARLVTDERPVWPELVPVDALGRSLKHPAPGVSCRSPIIAPTLAPVGTSRPFLCSCCRFGILTHVPNQAGLRSPHTPTTQGILMTQTAISANRTIAGLAARQ